MLLTIIIGSLLPSILSIILPRINIFSLNWLGPVSQIIWIPFITYSILKYRQMDIRIVVVEILALGMGILFFINIFMDIYINVLLKVLLFIVFVFLTIQLILTSLRESRQREELADLNLNLKHKVDEQTQEIRKSLIQERSAKRELEKLNETKNQFIVITQHSLRTPITTIKWEIESIISSGNVPEKLSKTLTKTLSSIENLNRIVDDFLNIITLKSSDQILYTSNTSIKQIFEEAIKDLRYHIDEMNISIDYPHENEAWPILNIDTNKIKEVITIILENAIRYNNVGGSVVIDTKIQDKYFILIINSTGIGIKDEELSQLFDKNFYRGRRAKEINPTGMGVGLSVSKAILSAHHGEINISSKGENHGATVQISLPV